EVGNAEFNAGNLAAASQNFNKAQRLLLGATPKRESTISQSEQLGRPKRIISSFGSNIGGTRGVSPSPMPPPEGLSDEIYDAWAGAKVSIRQGDITFESGDFH